MKKTILIFGVSSFVGSNLAELLSDEYRVIGTYHSHSVHISGVTCVPCDVLKKDYVAKLVGVFKPDFTIYSVGLGSVTECHANPKKAEALNSAGAVNCSMASERYGSKFIYISSCFVLGGGDVIYKQEDTPFPMTVFGSSLQSAEFYIQRSSLNYLIFRCAPIFGRSSNPHQPTWFECLQESLVKKNYFLADDFIETGFLDVYTMAKSIKEILKNFNNNGLIHLSSKDSMTRFQFAKMYSKIFGKDEDLIRPFSGNFPIDIMKRNSEHVDAGKHFFKLDVSFLENLIQTQMPTIEEMMKLTFQKLSR